MSAEPIVETVAFPEHLTIAGARALAAGFATYYLTPSFPPSTVPRYRSWQDLPTGRSEFYWPVEFAPPAATPSPGAPASAHAHAILTPDQVRVEFTCDRPVSDDQRAVLDRIADEVRAFVEEFLDHAKRSTLYLTLPAYPRTPQEKAAATPPGHGALKRIFTGNSTNLFLLAILLTLPAVVFFGVYALLLMVAFQAVAVFYSDRLAMRMGSVWPSRERPMATVVGVTLPTDAKHRPARLRRAERAELQVHLQDAISEATASGRNPVSAAVPVLRAAGLECSDADVEVTTRDVYGLVAAAAGRFGLAVPKVVVSDQGISNAAATGVSPRRASMMITAGSLEELDDAQLEAVIGHELGHIRGRDPILLVATSSVLYLGAVFLWPSVFLTLGLFYFILVFAGIYAVGKVLETRADTFSAIVLGRPGDLASALTAIAFTEWFLERRSRTIRFLNWLSLDPHPPIYFRVRRLTAMARRTRTVRHPLLDSARDVVGGFFGALIRPP